MADELEQMLEKAGEAFGTATEMLEDVTGWEEINSTGEITTYKKPTEYGYNAIKLEAFFDKPFKAAADYAYQHLHEWEVVHSDMASSTIEKTFNDGSMLRKDVTKPHGPVSAREGHNYVSKQELDENTISILATSSPQEHPVSEGNVKGDLKFSLQMFMPVGGDPNKTHYQVVECIDPKGNIPNMLINQIVVDRAKLYEGGVSELKKNL